VSRLISSISCGLEEVAAFFIGEEVADSPFLIFAVSVNRRD